MTDPEEADDLELSTLRNSEEAEKAVTGWIGSQCNVCPRSQVPTKNIRLQSTHHFIPPLLNQNRSFITRGCPSHRAYKKDIPA
ncbi:hypothetical protein CDAR_225971 [Caerostris darwini]|uniref:Uncharacterized protein n=1 Tax=Caerostris darwini TaxID=1538125 RepID=A0AAV4VKQ4_9ARAC|nr:hypothetical protein CDAR_225971 [Caerostris darwini]